MPLAPLDTLEVASLARCRPKQEGEALVWVPDIAAAHGFDAPGIKLALAVPPLPRADAPVAGGALGQMSDHGEAIGAPCAAILSTPTSQEKHFDPTQAVELQELCYHV
eukprot:490525-Amphidinium_carterae.3